MEEIQNKVEKFYEENDMESSIEHQVLDLMSELGKVSKEVLKVKEGKLLTYEKLQALGIDSVRIDKIGNSDFEINFARIGSYEQFKNIFGEK